VGSYRKFEVAVQAVEMRFLRRIAGLSRLDQVRNATVRELLNLEPLFLQIERSQLWWCGISSECRMKGSRNEPSLLSRQVVDLEEGLE
jgi:hypothetical protein